MEDKILTLLRAKRALMTLMFISFAALFAVGCGGSRDNFVATGNTGAQTGNLVFQFVRPQTTVDAAVTSLRFDAYGSNGGKITANLIVTETRTFANTITLNVSTQVVCVRVTGLNAAGFPIQFFDADNLTVVPNGTTNVALGGSNAVNFSSVAFVPTPVCLVVDADASTATSSQLTATVLFSDSSTNLPANINNTTTNFALTNTALFNVSTSGLFEVANPGGMTFNNTSCTASYTTNNVTQTQTFLCSIFGFSAAIDAGSPEDNSLTTSENFTGYYSVRAWDDNATPAIDVNTSSVYSLVGAPSQLSINASNGFITNTGSAPAGNFQVQVTWTGFGGKTFTDLINFVITP